MRSFGSVTVTDGVDFVLHPGERCAVIGPNGAGKTTFINLLTGRLRPSAGQVLLDGADVSHCGEARRARRGLARTFQITALFPALTVAENVFLAVAEAEGMAARLLRPALGHHRLLARVGQVLDQVGLADDADTQVQQLAYGRQRLLEVGLALAQDPRILILDEPTAGVPLAEVDRILALIEALPPEIAVLLVDHDMDLVFRFARRIVVMAEGRIIADGAPAAIAADAEVRRIYLGEGARGRDPAA
jgi:branched-chain amino acid transport system ATP-binding protein